eukprot:CAMPEP_0194068410 /NCGR_PEP_ID=MMETSP0009_2-20130614/87083_1 /TAXON_ID=210454 /ORGANISM="Grammatophora oceanica, Strain CCMP 410" /LENGTH=298 /DNA_ID=CAMNT_0038721511 /DNA_START=353 /DNA_END=1249 /DNA_ORIENTATION=+
MAPRQRSPGPVVEDPAEAAALLSTRTKDGVISSSRVSAAARRGKKKYNSTQDVDPATVALARERHDVFNLVALIPIISLTILSWDWGKVIRGEFETCYIEDYFEECWITTLIYFVVDLVWVARIPMCVKSPYTIIFHHFVALTYLLAPIMFPDYRWFMPAVLLVEINTWFLIARRVVYKQRGTTPLFESLDVASQELLIQAVSGCFYTTWIVVRCMVYPGILGMFLHMAYEAIQETGIYFHYPMIYIPIHTFFVLLNLKWTYDLFQPIVVRKWKNYTTTSTSSATTTTSRTSSVSGGL